MTVLLSSHNTARVSSLPESVQLSPTYPFHVQRPLCRRQMIGFCPSLLDQSWRFWKCKSWIRQVSELSLGRDPAISWKPQTPIHRTAKQCLSYPSNQLWIQVHIQYCVKELFVWVLQVNSCYGGLLLPLKAALIIIKCHSCIIYARVTTMSVTT